MLAILGIMTAAGGLFLLFWYRTLVSLPVNQQPRFIYPSAFKWGIPILGVLMFALGLFLLLEVRLWIALAAFAMAAVLAALLIRFDRYSANMRLIHDRYCKIRESNPDMDEQEVLYHTAQWRYPQWSHDRQVELVAGKGIEGLLLLMVITENKVNPISDWELYRSLKAKAASIAKRRV
jgi:hypothetical protein